MLSNFSCTLEICQIGTNTALSPRDLHYKGRLYRWLDRQRTLLWIRSRVWLDGLEPYWTDIYRFHREKIKKSVKLTKFEAEKEEEGERQTITNRKFTNL